eukprot:scaffold34695_cov266-Amphora_coffeaeformis.AAC.5
MASFYIHHDEENLRDNASMPFAAASSSPNIATTTTNNCYNETTSITDNIHHTKNDGEQPNVQLIHAVARFVVEEFYEKARESRMRMFAQWLKNAQLEQPDMDDPRKRRYELPTKQESGEQSSSPSAAVTTTTTLPSRIICGHALAYMFGVGPYVWNRCVEAATQADYLMSLHSFHRPPAHNLLDSNTKTFLLDFLQGVYDSSQVVEAARGIRRAPHCLRKTYLQYIATLGYRANKTPTCQYLVRPLADWPADKPHHAPVSKTGFIAFWKRHFPHLVPALTRYAKVSLLKDGTYFSKFLYNPRHEDEHQQDEDDEDDEFEDDDDNDDFSSSSGSEVESDSGSEDEIVIG